MLDITTLYFLCKRRTVPKECNKKVSTQFRGRKKRAPCFCPVECAGGWRFEWDPDPDRCADKPTIVPAFWGIVFRGRS